MPVIRVGPANVSCGGLPSGSGVSLLHRHRAISWYAFGVAWLSSGGGGGWGCSKDPVLCWIVDFAEISTGTYLCFSKLSVAFKLRGFGSSWMSAYCTDTGLSAGMYLG